MKRLVIVADGSVAAHGVRLALRQTSGFHIVGFIDGRRPAAATLVQARARTSSSSTTCADPDARARRACARSARPCRRRRGCC